MEKKRENDDKFDFVKEKKVKTNDNKDEPRHVSINKTIDDLISAVQRQKSVCGQIVFIKCEDDQIFTLIKTTAHFYNYPVNLIRSGNEFVLKINDEILARGKYANPTEAKNLAYKAFEELKKRCFIIIKKKHYKQIELDKIADYKTETNGAIAEKKHDSNVFNGNTAHKMMIKMGWNGGGLGVAEQGSTNPVKSCGNLRRLGFGIRDIEKGVTRVLKEYSESSALTTLAFDPDLNSEERKLIHRLAQKYNLKSKSEGKGSRRITITRKIPRYNLVKEILRIGGENESYRLEIPSNFQHLFNFN